MASRAWTAYRSALTRRPYLTSAVTSALVLASGDVLAQSLEHRQYLQSHPAATASDTPALRLQPNRTLILSVWGGAFFSPFFTRVFHWLETVPALKQPTPRNLVLRALTIFARQPAAQHLLLPLHQHSRVLPARGQAGREAHPSQPLSPHHSRLLRLQTTGSASLSPPSPPASVVSGTDSVRGDHCSRASAQIVEKAPTVIRNALLVWGTFNYFVRQQQHCTMQAAAADCAVELHRLTAAALVLLDLIAPLCRAESGLCASAVSRGDGQRGLRLLELLDVSSCSLCWRSAVALSSPCTHSSIARCLSVCLLQVDDGTRGGEELRAAASSAGPEPAAAAAAGCAGGVPEQQLKRISQCNDLYLQ